MKILVGYDDSKAAESALEVAQKHGQVFNGTVHIMMSLEQSASLKKEDIDKAAERVLSKKAGIKGVYLEQLHNGHCQGPEHHPDLLYVPHSDQGCALLVFPGSL